MKWLSNHDSLTIIVGLVEEPTESPREAVVLDVLEAGVGDSDEEIVGRLVAALSDEGVPPPFDLSVTHSVFSWGASGSGLHILLSVSSAVVGKAAWAALKGALQGLADRAAERSPWLDNPVSRDEALSRVRWYLASIYKVDQDELLLTEEEQSESADGRSAWRFRFTTTGRSFTADVSEEAGGLLRFTRHSAASN